MKAWPRITTLAVRSRLRPRIGLSLAFRRPWSASTRLLAYWVVSWRAAGKSSATTCTRAWARSVVISDGSPWETMADAKKVAAALRSRLLDRTRR
jgi:hypothetical protein